MTRKTIRISFIFSLFLCVSCFATEQLTIGNADKANIAKKVVIMALNKITAKSYKFTINVGDKKEFGRIVIEPLFCWKSLPEDLPENKVLLKIKENIVNSDQQKELFYGWMFSANSSISSLEHPMYDVRIVDCEL